MKKCLPALVCVLALCACARSAPTNYYILESDATPARADNLPEKTLRVAQVETASYLNRNNIVSRVKGRTQLILAEFHLWAEPVAAGVRRVVEETLFQPLLDAGVTTLPPGTASGGDYVLLLDVQRLDGNFNDKAVLECRWSLLDRDEKTIESGVYAAEEQVPGADYDILTATESKLVREMGAALAAVLPGVINRRGGK